MRNLAEQQQGVTKQCFVTYFHHQPKKVQHEQKKRSKKFLSFSMCKKM